MRHCSQSVCLSVLSAVIALLTQPGRAQAGDQLANYRCRPDVSSVSCLDFSRVDGGVQGSSRVGGLCYCLSFTAGKLD